MRGLKLRAGEGFSGAVVVEPPLAWLEARDYRVTRSGGSASMHADSVNYHNNRCDRILHICGDGTTIRLETSTRRKPFRLAWLRG
jgi:hypothetical protein